MTGCWDEGGIKLKVVPVEEPLVQNFIWSSRTFGGSGRNWNIGLHLALFATEKERKQSLMQKIQTF